MTDTIKLTFRADQLEGHPDNPDLLVFRISVDLARDEWIPALLAATAHMDCIELDVAGHG